MNKKVIVLLFIFVIVAFVGVFSIFFSEKSTEIDVFSSEEIARNWIENSAPTYLFDGIDLQLIDARILDCPDCVEFTYSFISSSAGYGDRTDMLSAQIITPHTIKVSVRNGRIVEAVTDGVFSELENRMIAEEMVEELAKEDVFVYFGKIETEEVIGLIREVEKGLSIEEATLRKLLDGPTEEEKEDGYFTSINEEVMVQSFKIEDGVIFVDFSKELEEGVAGSARVMAIRSQIEETLKQFDTIEEVVISIDGETEDVLQP